jgi:filamentous hemagglutinin family protein
MKTKQVLALKPLVSALRTWAGLAALPGVALAGPLGEVVQQGVVGVTRPDALTTEVTQTSQHAVVNWQTFSVGGQEYVKFVQPGTNAAILNRVVGGEASSILGRIDANGRVFLVNPQGVYFGAGARVEAGGFAASALDIADEDFMAGRYVFAKGSGSTGTVENHGELRGEQFVALLGERVTNAGLIEARLGTVALGAGERVTLTLDDAGLVSFAVDEATAAALAGVENTGALVADGGRVVMSASVADGLVATAVNNAGVVKARGVEVAEGGIYLRGSGGSVVNSGTLDADGERGGLVRVTSTEDVVVTSGATVSARGEAAGGEVRLIAQQDLRVESGALVDVRSEAAGQGGLIEVSALSGAVQVEGELKTGGGGELIVDPARVRIDAGAGGIGSDGGVTTIAEEFIEGQLSSSGDFTLHASNEIFSSATALSPITINSSGPGGLVLRIAVPNGSGFLLDSDGAINLQHVNFDIGGLFHAQAGFSNGQVTLGAVNARDLLRIEAGSEFGNVTTGPLAVTSLSNAVIDIDAPGLSGTSDQGIVTINGGVVAQAQGTSLGKADIDIRARSLNITGPVTASAAAASTDAEADINLIAGTLTVNGGVLATAAYADASANLRALSGNAQLGAVRALAGATGNAEVSLFASGALSASGLVEARGRDADIDVEARQLNLQGGLRASALGPDQDAHIGLFARRGANVLGSTTVEALDGGDAELFVSNTASYGGGSGDVVFQNLIALTGGNLAEASLYNEHGAVRTGPVDVRQAGAATTPQGAYFNAEAATDVRLLGPTEVAAEMGPAVVVADANGLVETQNPMLVKSAGNSAIVDFSGTNIALRNTLTVEGAESGLVSLSASGGSIVANGPALLTATTIGFELENASLVDVRTNAETLYFMMDDAQTGISIDNSARAGETLVYLGSPEYLGSPDQGSGSTAPPAGAMSGPVKALFRGDTYVVGDFAARNAMVEVMEGSLVFSGPVLIGDLNLPPTEGDSISLQALALARRPDGSAPGLPRFDGAPTTGANAVFQARDGLFFEQGLAFDDPDTPYVAFITDGPLELGPGVSSVNPRRQDFLAQFTAYTKGRPIFVEDSFSHGLSGPVFTRADHFAKLPGTTLIIGNSRVNDFTAAGDITVGRNGSIDIGDQNILFATAGRVTGVGNIRSTGFVGELSSVSITEQINQAFPLPFAGDIRPEPPVDAGKSGGGRSGERDDDKDEDEDYVDIDDTGEGESSGLVAQRDNSGQMCQ